MTQDILDLDKLTQRIRNKMDQLGLNQAQLAKKAGITAAAITQILKKERTPSTTVVIKLAKALDVSVDFLVGQANNSALADILQQPESQNFYQSFSDLSQSDKSQVLDMINFLKNKKEKK